MKANHILGVFLISILAFGCLKYEEGAYLTIKKPEKRLSRSWTYSAATHNGLNVLTGSGPNGIDYASSSIGFDEGGRFSEIVVFERDSIEANRLDGEWSFSNEETELKLTYDLGAIEINYSIIRLAVDELKLEKIYSDEKEDVLILELISE